MIWNQASSTENLTFAAEDEEKKDEFRRMKE